MINPVYKILQFPWSRNSRSTVFLHEHRLVSQAPSQFHPWCDFFDYFWYWSVLLKGASSTPYIQLRLEGNSTFNRRNHSHTFARILSYFGPVFHVRCRGRLTKNRFFKKWLTKSYKIVGEVGSLDILPMWFWRRVLFSFNESYNLHFFALFFARQDFC